MNGAPGEDPRQPSPAHLPVSVEDLGEEPDEWRQLAGPDLDLVRVEAPVPAYRLHPDPVFPPPDDPAVLVGQRLVRPEDLELAAFLILHSVEAAIHAAVVERPGYVRDGRLGEELTRLVLGYLKPEDGAVA